VQNFQQKNIADLLTKTYISVVFTH